MLGPERSTVLAAGDPAAIAAAEQALYAGGIVGLPTDTVYGLAVLPHPTPLAALVAAKGRPTEKGIALLIDGLDQVTALVDVTPMAWHLADALWPGPLTLVLPLRHPNDVPTALTGGRATLGVRVPDHPVPRALARRLGPLAVSSANRSGEPEALTAAELVAAVGESLALTLDDGPVHGGIASTVVEVSDDGSLVVLREGAIGRGQIDAVARGRS